jgi:hypothetical protein
VAPGEPPVIAAGAGLRCGYRDRTTVTKASDEGPGHIALGPAPHDPGRSIVNVMINDISKDLDTTVLGPLGPQAVLAA